jgi:hypothetical protein
MSALPEGVFFLALMACVGVAVVEVALVILWVLS